MKRRHVLPLWALIALLYSPSLRAAGHNKFCNYRDNGGAFLRDRGILVAGSNYRTHVVEAQRSAKPVTVLVEGHPQYVQALKDLRSGAYPKGSVAIFDFSPDPELGLSDFDAKLDRVKILHDIPETVEQAMLIHGQAYTRRIYEAAMPTLAALRSELNSRGAIDLTETRRTSVAERLQKILAVASPTELHVLVAHRELKPSGDALLGEHVLQFHDGSQFDLSANTRSAALLWVISCETWTSSRTINQFDRAALLSTKRLTYGLGVRAAKVLESSVSVRDAIMRMQNAQRIPNASEEAPVRGASHPRTSPPSPTFHFVVEVNPGRVMSTSEYTALA